MDNRGRHKQTEKTKQILREYNLGKKQSVETVAKRVKKLIGIPRSEETKHKISESRHKKMELLGYLNSPETRKKMSNAKKGMWWGEKIITHATKIYSVDWTNSLRISIRERDHYTCQLCGEKQGDRAFSVHHIDYNKQNCDPVNLITLCGHCHSKTNLNNREYWIEYFKKLQC
jgi:hypothetical protein